MVTVILCVFSMSVLKVIYSLGQSLLNYMATFSVAEPHVKQQSLLITKKNCYHPISRRLNSGLLLFTTGF